jgi:protein-S-isoprenylcysteine O-methyltransferase Ste14
MPLWLRSAGFTVFVPGVVAGLLPWWIANGSERLAFDIGPLRWIGLLPLAAGILVYLATTWQFGVVGRGTPAPWDAPRKLVRSGLHARVRNPMYLGVLLCIAGEALIWQAGELFIYLAVAWLAFHLRVLWFEEPVLRRSFGAASTTTPPPYRAGGPDRGPVGAREPNAPRSSVERPLRRCRSCA